MSTLVAEDLANAVEDESQIALTDLRDNILEMAGLATDCGEMPQELYDAMVESVTQKLSDGVRDAMEQAMAGMAQR